MLFDELGGGERNLRDGRPEWVGMAVATLFFVEFGQIVQCQRDGAVGPARFLIDRPPF
jgi:hypothetical protein